MSDLDKKYTIRLDLIDNIQNEKMRFSLSDNETSDFYINITKSMKKVDLTYKTVKLYVVKPNKNVIYTTVTPYTECNDTNVFYCDLPNDFKNIKGTYYAQMLVEDMITGEKVVAPSKFSYIVESDIMSEMYEVADTEENKNILDSILRDLADLKINRVTINDSTPGSTTIYSSNKIETIKEELSSQIDATGGSSGGGEVDLSGYVTKETGKANQITFSDGQTFQAKLDAGILKGDKGDQGEQGIQGEKGDKGDKGEPGEPGASNINDTTASATTTYSSNKIESIKEGLNSQITNIANKKTDKSTTDNIQQQVDNLVLGAVGDGNNAEIIQARGRYDLLNDRITMIDNYITYQDYFKYFSYKLKTVYTTGELGDSSKNNRITNELIMPLRKGDYITTSNGYTFRVFLYGSQNQSDYLGSDKIVYTSKLIEDDCYARIWINNADESSLADADINDILSNVTFLRYRDKNIKVYKHHIEFEQWDLDEVTGSISSFVNSRINYCRSKLFMKVGSSSLVELVGNYAFKLFEYDKDYNFLGSRDINKVFITREDTQFIKIVANIRSVPEDVYIICDSEDIFYKNVYIEDEFNFNYEVGEYFTSGVLKLPKNYKNRGTKTPLIVFVQGTNDYRYIHECTLSTYYKDCQNYLVNEGYAIFLCYPWTSKYTDVGGCPNYGTPTGIKAYIDGYKYLLSNYNFDDEVYVMGKSSGGYIGSVLNNFIPVRAVSLLAPALIPIARSYGPSIKTIRAVFDDFGFEGNCPYDQYDEYYDDLNRTKTDEENQYFLDNIDKIRGYNATFSNLLESDDKKLIDSVNGSTFTCEFTTDYDKWKNSYRMYKSPIKIFIAEDDDSVPYNASKVFIRQIKNANKIAFLRTMPSGTGGHNSVDYDVNALKGSGITKLGISYTDIALAYIETVQFFRKFE